MLCAVIYSDLKLIRMLECGPVNVYMSVTLIKSRLNIVFSVYIHFSLVKLNAFLNYAFSAALAVGGQC